MKLNVRALAWAGGTIAAALFALCTMLVAATPGATVWATRELFHVAVAGPPAVTASGLVAGLLFWFFGAAATGAAFASLYNRWVRS